MAMVTATEGSREPQASGHDAACGNGEGGSPASTRNFHRIPAKAVSKDTHDTHLSEGLAVHAVRDVVQRH